MSHHPRRILVILPTLVLLAATARAEVRRVDDDAPPGGDGLSWETAYADLQDALEEARTPGSPVTELWIAAGTYVPDPFDATASFVLVDGVAIYGGFAGDEETLGERDWLVHETILSGDIGADDVVGSGSGWYLGWNIGTSNSGHVVDGSGVGPATILDGLVIADGHTGPAGTPAGDPLMYGGGLFLVGGSPTVRHCTFTHCLAAFAHGGAVYLLDGSPVFEDCHFLENYVHLGDGGGLFTYGASVPVVRDCTFTWNIGVAGTGDTSGAGFAHRASTDITVERCRFHGNVSRPFYSLGDELGWGGGLWNWTGHMTVRDCRFTSNRANIGGGFMTWGPATLLNCLFTENDAVPQPNDPFPEQGGTGAALSGYSSQADGLVLRGCTVADNHGKKHAIEITGNQQAILRNTVVWGNTATGEDVIGTWRTHLGGDFDAAYSCIALIFDPPEPGEDPIDPENIPGCIDLDPLFVGAGDYHLGAGSPCIDAGDSGEVPVQVAADLDGLPRIADDPGTPDTGAGGPPVVDMGAYEVQPALPPCPADLDGTGDVGFADLLAVLSAWGSCPGCAEDLDGSGDVGFSDLLAVLSAWGPCA